MLRLGFVGFGNIARYHTQVIQRNGLRHVRIAAGADVDPKARQAFRAAFPEASCHQSYEELLERAQVDAVCVALPTGLHARATVAAARAGRHVFCEKPMALTLRDCDRMMDACTGAGVTLMVGHVRRYDRDWATWARLVHAGAVGRPVLWRQLSGGGPPGDWYMDEAVGGGPFMDGCVHNWDYANLVFGSPAQAVGSLLTLGPGTALDTGCVTVRYHSGDEVALCWSWGLPPGARGASASEILGPRGIIRFPGTFPESDLPEEFDRARRGAYLVDRGSGRRVVSFARRDMFGEEWKDFYRAVTQRIKPRATPEQARQAVAVALAVLRAGRTRRAVRIP